VLMSGVLRERFEFKYQEVSHRAHREKMVCLTPVDSDAASAVYGFRSDLLATVTSPCLSQFMGQQWVCLDCYTAYCFLLVTAIRPSKPEPNNQIAAGTGTTTGDMPPLINELLVPSPPIKYLLPPI
jgi:hypothetical protein